MSLRPNEKGSAAPRIPLRCVCSLGVPRCISAGVGGKGLTNDGDRSSKVYMRIYKPCTCSCDAGMCIVVVLLSFLFQTPFLEGGGRTRHQLWEHVHSVHQLLRHLMSTLVASMYVRSIRSFGIFAGCVLVLRCVCSFPIECMVITL